VLGAIALRHELNDRLLELGHIGYGIRPSARRRGLATWALGRMLGEARVLGLDRVLLVCEAGNVASAKTIERHRGVLETIRDTEHGPMRRYWIKTGEASA
jgi:predicted acetyltransferase